MADNVTYCLYAKLFGNRFPHIFVSLPLNDHLSSIDGIVWDSASPQNRNSLAMYSARAALLHTATIIISNRKRREYS